MKKANVILAVVFLMTIAIGCGIRKKDRCPTVGQANHGMVERK